MNGDNLAKAWAIIVNPETPDVETLLWALDVAHQYWKNLSAEQQETLKRWRAKHELRIGFELIAAGAQIEYHAAAEGDLIFEQPGDDTLTAQIPRDKLIAAAAAIMSFPDRPDDQDDQANARVNYYINLFFANSAFWPGPERLSLSFRIAHLYRRAGQRWINNLHHESEEDGGGGGGRGKRTPKEMPTMTEQPPSSPMM